MIPKKTVSVVVLNEANQVLLHQREDFRIWALPGGHIEPGENWEQAAIREVAEETGYQIVVDRLVGEYWQPDMPGDGVLKYVGAGRVVGGQAIKRGPETLQVRWFEIEQLPFSLLDQMREYIQDAGANHPTPLKKTQRMPRWQAVAFKYLLKLRDWRNRGLKG
jgi:ADP-ribose pyrophosphatase YjhB (NUDIX family)